MKNKRFFALFLSLVLILCMGTTAFAASSTTATVPVTLTVDNQYRAVNVTVPASLPVYVINGTVITADILSAIKEGEIIDGGMKLKYPRLVVSPRPDQRIEYSDSSDCLKIFIEYIYLHITPPNTLAYSRG